MAVVLVEGGSGRVGEMLSVFLVNLWYISMRCDDLSCYRKKNGVHVLQDSSEGVLLLKTTGGILQGHYLSSL